MRRQEPRALTREDLERLKIGRHYWTADLEELHQGTRHRRLVLEYCDKIHRLRERGKGLLLWGDNGRGKTYAAACILKFARSWGYSGLLVRATDIVPSIVEGWEFERNLHGRQNYEQRMRSVDFLVIDDLGKEIEGKSGFSVSALDRILRDRAQDAKPVIITTNLPLSSKDPEDPTEPPSVQSRYGRSTYDLIHETTYPFQVKGRGNSERQIAAGRCKPNPQRRP